MPVGSDLMRVLTLYSFDSPRSILILGNGYCLLGTETLSRGSLISSPENSDIVTCIPGPEYAGALNVKKALSTFSSAFNPIVVVTVVSRPTATSGLHEILRSNGLSCGNGGKRFRGRTNSVSPGSGNHQ